MMQLLVKSIYASASRQRRWLSAVDGAVRMHLEYIKSSLGASVFLTGSAFTVADVQMSFPLDVGWPRGCSAALTRSCLRS